MGESLDVLLGPWRAFRIGAVVLSGEVVERLVVVAEYARNHDGAPSVAVFNALGDSGVCRYSLGQLVGFVSLKRRCTTSVQDMCGVHLDYNACSC